MEYGHKEVADSLTRTEELLFLAIRTNPEHLKTVILMAESDWGRASVQKFLSLHGGEGSESFDLSLQILKITTFYVAEIHKTLKGH